jgi:hypothetical protein
MQNEPSETQAETERYLRDRVEELEIILEACEQSFALRNKNYGKENHNEASNRTLG